MGEEYGRGIWERNLGEEYGRGIWKRNMVEESGGGIWNLREESGRNQGIQRVPRSHPGGTRRPQEAPRRHHGHPGDTQGTQEARLGSEMKVCQIIFVFSAKVARPGIWLEV